MRRVACLAAVTIFGVTLAAVSNEAQQARHAIRPLELTGNLYVLASDPAGQGMRTGGNTAVFRSDAQEARLGAKGAQSRAKNGRRCQDVVSLMVESTDDVLGGDLCH